VTFVALRLAFTDPGESHDTLHLYLIHRRWIIQIISQSVLSFWLKIS